MNDQGACNILEIEKDQDITIEIIKRQYRKKALQFHPDKNKAPDASRKFHETHAAYEHLCKKYEYYDIGGGEEIPLYSNKGYAWILSSFLKNVVGQDVFNDMQSRMFYTIIQKVANCCENKAIEILEKLDKPVLIKIYSILKMHQDVFHFSDTFLLIVEEIIQKKAANDQRIILYTFLDDLFANNLYKINHNGETYIIPLWHDELVYDNNGDDLYVQCVPILPDNIKIDEKSNLHVYLNYKMCDLWEKPEIQVVLGNQTMLFFPSQLKICKNQSWVIAGKGISKINNIDVYDISRRGDVHLHIEIDL